MNAPMLLPLSYLAIRTNPNITYINSLTLQPTTLIYMYYICSEYTTINIDISSYRLCVIKDVLAMKEGEVV